MRNESQDNFSALRDTVSMGGEAPTPQTVPGDAGKRRSRGKKKRNTVT